MLKVAIVGATGYTGEELVKILIDHPEAEITSLTAKIDQACRISDVFPRFCGKIDLECANLEDIAEVASKSQVVFLALPHRVSMSIAPEFLKLGKRVIDLSADYRLRDIALYEQWYKARHSSPSLAEEAVYGLPELYREEIKKAKLIANPGCYPTGIILALAPLLEKGLIDHSDIIIDSKTGLTGAGRKAAIELHFSEITENFKAYKINQHQHLPEINQELTKLAKHPVKITFVPHLAPINRGILSTIYLNETKKTALKDLLDIFKNFYKNEPFVRIKAEGQSPQLKEVVETNFCNIGIWASQDSRRIIIISAIDNLGKGAAGQAVQNMNIMFGFQETAGLI
ncbi:MAG: N-acetyl-gamma-glutamyl-phosphate reductase [Candidatus Omnitrophota bacterium]|nr:N-acetyl-gamma-glutamyl-phosphate reductase [Candidatus Omnitrophota bacterium]